MVSILALLDQIEETAQQSADMASWDAEPILKGVELIREQLQAGLPAPGDYHVEVGVTGYGSPLDAAWGAQSLFTGEYLPIVTVTAPDGTRHDFDLTKAAPPDDTGNPGCDNCGVEDAAGRVRGQLLCTDCGQGMTWDTEPPFPGAWMPKESAGE